LADGDCGQNVGQSVGQSPGILNDLQAETLALMQTMDEAAQADLLAIARGLVAQGTTTT
jgi:hypothetical protein